MTSRDFCGEPKRCSIIHIRLTADKSEPLTYSSEYVSKMQRGCELCEGVAALYCAADKAHICWPCDAKVHGANFLVARHTRSVLCTACATPTAWRASGANPAPLTGLCVNCSQGESQGECTTGNTAAAQNAVQTSAEANVVVQGHIRRAVSGSESGCSSSDPLARDTTATATVRDEGGRSKRKRGSGLSSLNGEDMEMEGASVTVESMGSVSSGISKSFGCCSPGGVAPCKQIATRAWEDVNGSVACGQSECANTTSLAANTQRGTHAHQDNTICVARDCNNGSQTQVELFHSSSKRLQMDNNRGVYTRPAPLLPGSSQGYSNSRSTRMLAKWHWDLRLSSPGTVPLALRMFRKALRALAPAVLSNAGMRVTLAACLRLAAGLDDAQIVVPNASEVAACAGVSTRRLAMTEIHLLALLGWRRRFPMWARIRA